jgi:hypothetical protein
MKGLEPSTFCMANESGSSRPFAQNRHLQRLRHKRANASERERTPNLANLATEPGAEPPESANLCRAPPSILRDSANVVDRRPVTPEVAGSSPVAPAKSPVNRHFLLPARRKTTAGFVSSRAHPAPEIAAQSRLKPVIPAGKTTGHIAGRPPEAGCRCCAFAAVSSNEASA